MANWFERVFYGDLAEQMSAPVAEAEPDTTSVEAKGEQNYAQTLREIADDEANRADRIVVNHSTALELSTVLACARVIAEGLAQVPCKVHYTDAKGSRKEATDHPLFDLLLYSPNDWQTSFEFREQVGLHLALTNNAFIYVTRNSKGQPLELYAFEPQSVTVTRHNDYTFTYQVTTLGTRGGKRLLSIPPENMWHIRGLSWDGTCGLDAVAMAREAIGLGLATERYGANLFRNGARPGGVLSTEAPLTPEQVDKLRQTWNSQQAGNANAHKTAILPNGLTFQAIASNADEAQWTESRRYQVEEICRFFRVNPVMVMHQANATSYNSIEQLFLAHLTHTLMPWFQRFEQSAHKALLTPAEKKAGFYIKLHERALLRASTADRLAYYNGGRTQGWLSINEIREKEDMPRSDDPMADQLTPAANLFGAQSTSTGEATQNDN